MNNIENEYRLTEETVQQTDQSTRRRWSRLALVSPLLFSVLVVGCARGTTSQVGDDVNSDGMVDVLDARARFGADWLPGLDFNDDLIIDEKDVGLVRGRVGTKPDIALFNVDGKNGITCEDVAIVESHLGETVEADPESRRLRDETYDAKQMVIHFRQDTPQEKINELLIEQRQYEILDQQPLTFLKKIQVIAEIPEEVLERSSLDREIEEVSQANGVLSAKKVKIDISDDIIGQAQPCP